MESAFDKARQLFEETGLDRETRKEGDFKNLEQSMPSRGFGIPILDDVSSYLGSHNPLASPVDPATESVWLFDNTAYRPIHPYPHAPQAWQAEHIAAYFKKGTGRDLSKAVADIADKIGLGKDDGLDRKAGEQTIAHRLQPFCDAIAPARLVNAEFPDGSVHQLGPGGRSGVSTQIIKLDGNHKDGEDVTVAAEPEVDAPHGPMSTTFAGPEGWAVISGKSSLPIRQSSRSLVSNRS